MQENPPLKIIHFIKFTKLFYKSGHIPRCGTRMSNLPTHTAVFRALLRLLHSPYQELKGNHFGLGF